MMGIDRYGEEGGRNNIKSLKSFGLIIFFFINAI